MRIPRARQWAVEAVTVAESTADSKLREKTTQLLTTVTKKYNNNNSKSVNTNFISL